ncbi:hypothetical protein [Streptomyces sp. NPDC008139]|uniref:hypothetical protein n=1 Tax=Streptomyces sp. NPDC008139 TaxID=3364814 RepID=UPI0036E450BF
MRYDRAAFIRCRLHVEAGPQSGYGEYEGEEPAFNNALFGYYQGLEAALEGLFGATLVLRRAAATGGAGAGGGTGDRALLMLLGSSVRSYLATGTPWSGYLEAGLLIRRLEAAGEAGERVLGASRRIEEAVKASRAAHLEMLDALVGEVLGERAGAAFDSAELRAAGFDDATYPRVEDFPDEGA